VGPNGAGKTTLLEALYLASTGRSFRAPRLEVCARRGTEAFAVFAEVGRAPRRKLGLAWRRDSGVERTLDGKSATAGEQLAALPLLVWTHAESELISGPPELRRRFFDRGLVHLRPALLESLGRYQAALREKRALLASRRGEERQLSAWNEILGRHGWEIARARGELVEGLGTVLERLRTIADLPPLSLRYRPSPPAATESAESLARALEKRGREERERGQPLAGPHRDEIEVLWDGAEARRMTSAGERKATGLLLLVALATRLGEAGRAPALLVDDADTELDATRLARLTKTFAPFTSVVATSNRPEVWPASAGLETIDVGALSERPGTRS